MGSVKCNRVSDCEEDSVEYMYLKTKCMYRCDFYCLKAIAISTFYTNVYMLVGKLYCALTCASKIMYKTLEINKCMHLVLVKPLP